MIHLETDVFIFDFLPMWVRKNFERLRGSIYYNSYRFVSDYRERNNLSLFIIMLENIDINHIRYKEKKELLKVLEYVFEKYRLHSIESNYLKWYTFINNYCPFLISEREYIILEYILRLKEQLWWYYMQHYNIYYNIALDYISKYKKYDYFHNKYHNIKEKTFDKTKPSFYNFPWKYTCDEKGFIGKIYYKSIVN